MPQNGRDDKSTEASAAAAPTSTVSTVVPAQPASTTVQVATAAVPAAPPASSEASAAAQPDVKQGQAKPLQKQGAPVELKYFDLAGKPRDYPNLAKINKVHYETNRKRYDPEIKKCDFMAESTDSQFKIGAAQHLGTKFTQEDRLVVGKLSSTFGTLTKRNKRRLMQAVPLILHRLSLQEKIALGQGSTFSMVVRQGTNVHNINVGDCVAIVAYVNKKTGKIDRKHIKQINREHGLEHLLGKGPRPIEQFDEWEIEPHWVKDPTDPTGKRELYVYVQETSGGWGAFRLARSFGNFYQSIGDIQAEKDGLSHAGEYYPPETLKAILPNDYDPAKYTQCIVLATDALKNSFATLEESRVAIERAIGKDSPKNVANEIVKQAMAKETNDNFTLIYSESNPDSQDAEYLITADGHGNSDQVAELIKEKAHEVSEKCLALVVADQKIEEDLAQKIKIDLQAEGVYQKIKDLTDIEALYHELAAAEKNEKINKAIVEIKMQIRDLTPPSAARLPEQKGAPPSAAGLFAGSTPAAAPAGEKSRPAPAAATSAAPAPNSAAAELKSPPPSAGSAAAAGAAPVPASEPLPFESLKNSHPDLYQLIQEIQHKNPEAKIAEAITREKVEPLEAKSAAAVEDFTCLLQVVDAVMAIRIQFNADQNELHLYPPLPSSFSVEFHDDGLDAARKSVQSLELLAKSLISFYEYPAKPTNQMFSKLYMEALQHYNVLPELHQHFIKNYILSNILNNPLIKNVLLENLLSAIAQNKDSATALKHTAQINVCLKVEYASPKERMAELNKMLLIVYGDYQRTFNREKVPPILEQNMPKLFLECSASVLKKQAATAYQANEATQAAINARVNRGNRK